MTEVLLARHGQTTGLISGWWADPSLSELGRAEARILARRLHSDGPIAALYCSPLKRARETAEIVAGPLGLRVVVCPDLREIDMRLIGELGAFLVARKVAELRHPPAPLAPVLRWPHTERPREYVARVGRPLDEIVLRHQGERVLVVSHAGTIRALLAHYFPSETERWWATAVRRCSVTRLQVASDRTVLLALDDRPVR